MPTLDSFVKLIAAVFVLTLFLVSCSGNKAYQHKTLSYSTKDLAECDQYGGALEHVIEKNADYHLGFVEVDEQGVFFSRDQFKNLTCQLTQYAQSSGIIISVFVHGWHHNAKADDPNLKNFKDSLITLSQFERAFAKKKGNTPRKTVGIFIGWRGESIEWDLISDLTFWERKNVAEETAKRSVLEALLRLEKIRNLQPSEIGKSVNRLFVLGHSFGADVVYNALSSIMLERLIGNKNEACDNKTIKGFGDFVFLLNPAFESLQYINFSSFFSEKNNYCKNQFPILAILTSQQDKATKYAFPLGRKLSTLFETYKDIDVLQKNGEKISISQRKLDTTAIGHEEIFFTHELKNNKSSHSSKGELIENECNIMRDFRHGWVTKKKEYELDDVILKNTNQYSPKTPYLVIHVDKEIIPDHNKIYANQVLNFMRRLTVISTKEEICANP